jgi:hypothetical protein
MAGSQYRDPASERLSNGRAMADLMRRGPHGLRGVVVSKATPGGAPSGYNPHDRSAMEIHVEPDGGNAVLTLDKFTQARVDAALEEAGRVSPGADIDATRERAAVAFETLARMSNSGVQRVPIKTAKAPPPPAQVDPDETALMDELVSAGAELQQMDDSAPRARRPAPPVEKIDRSYSPMAAFGLKKHSISATSAPVVARSAAADPPQKLVYFEKEGIGTVPAFFHDVLVNVARPEPDSPEESGFITLVYDVRFEQSAARWFPPSDDPYQRPWAVQINDDNRLYLVHTTGFQYIYDSREFCILRVEKALRALEVAE